MSSQTPLRVVIAEDSVLLRAGITRLLVEAGDDVVAAVDNGEALLAAVGTHQPDVCVVDVRMPPTFTDEGIRAAVQIRQNHPNVGVLVLSQYVEERYATELLVPTQGSRGRCSRVCGGAASCRCGRHCARP
jgi:DNA-binding NarL/FixJ family response regulator